jgi:Glycosyltransferase family 87
LIALLLAGSMWWYVQNVLIPYQRADAAAHGRPRGNLSDLYPRWFGARELLLNHRNPYSPEVTREIEAGYYGRPLDPNRAEGPRDQQGFAYPVYVVFLLAPTVHLPFVVVQEGFRWLLVALTISSVPLWLAALRWRPSPTIATALIVLGMGSFPIVQGIKLQQLSLLVAAIIAACMASIATGHLLAAGVLLALATIKPQLAAPLAGWLVLWGLGDWQQRKGLIWGFAITLTTLLGAAQYILPGWISDFYNAVVAYRKYTAGAGSLLDTLITPGWGEVLSLMIMVALACICWRLRHEKADSFAFALVSSLVLAATVVIVPMVAPYNQALLLPGILLLVREGARIWSKNRLARFSCVAAALLVLWPWVATVSLALASIALPTASLESAWAVPLYTSLGIPLGILGLLCFLVRDLFQSEEKFS